MIASASPLASTGAAVDCELLAAIARRDEQALSAVYDKYAPLCYNVAYRIAHDRGAADAILHDAFLKVWNKAASYDGRGSVAGWIVRITRNRALDWLRYERAHTDRIAYSWEDDQANQERDSAAADESANPEERMLRLDRRGLLYRALKQLPAEQRSAVELSFLEGLTHHAIAARTGLPLGTVKTRVRLGLQKLRLILTAS
jgi:RNA polymerase sigma-70 factor (ECF subfamily)